MPYYASAEQVMRDRSEYARKGISRGRSVAVLTYADGILFIAENPSSTLHKIGEIYDRIGFAAVGRYSEFESLRVAGVRLADVRGYSYNLISSDRPTSVGFVTRGADDEFGPVRNTVVANTTIWMTGGSSQGVVCYGGCTTALLTVRNTIATADRAVYVDGPFVDQNNLYAGTAQGTVTSRVLSAAAVGLTDPAAGDFVPTADSPAVDAGTDVDQPTAPVDAAGTRVTDTPDIGAFERP